MARRPLQQRPLRSLGKLAPKLPKPSTSPKPAKPAAAPPAPTFAEAMLREGTVPLAPSPGRVLAAKRNQTKASAPAAPTFRVDTQDGFIEGQRTRLPARALARLSGPPQATLDLHRRD